MSELTNEQIENEAMDRYPIYTIPQSYARDAFVAGAEFARSVCEDVVEDVQPRELSEWDRLPGESARAHKLRKRGLFLRDHPEARYPGERTEAAE